MNLNSIKIKFAFFFTIMTFVIVILFSSVIYYLNIVHSNNVLTQQDLIRMARFSPRVRLYLQETKDIDNAKELAQLVKHSQDENFINTLIITIPIILFFSAILSFLVSSYLVRPIEEISFYLTKIKSGNLKTRLPMIKSSREIENLIVSINLLLERLESAFIAQEQFIQDAAHELRTPITAMRTHLEVIKKKDNLSLNDYIDALDVLEELNKKLLKLNEDLLFLNRPLKSDDLDIIDLEELIEEIIEEYFAKASKKKINIVFNTKSTSKIQANRPRLARAIGNIIDNAIKYTVKKNSKIVLDLYDKRDKVILSIKDEGIGIAKEDIEKIFKRFYRGKNAIDMAVVGDGLGLSIVKKVLDDIGAKIEIKSIKNKGSEFILIFQKLK